MMALLLAKRTAVHSLLLAVLLVCTAGLKLKPELKAARNGTLQLPGALPVPVAQVQRRVDEAIPSIFVAVFNTRSTPAEQRNVVRGMWRDVDGGQGQVCARHIFCRQATDGFQPTLDAENAANGDMLFLDCQEGYAQGLLTRKVIATMAAFQSQVHDPCLNKPLFMKTDDDTFVAGHRFRQQLHAAYGLHGQTMYGGVGIPSQPPNRDPNSAWYEPPEVFPGQNYPASMYGGPGYILGRTMIDRIIVDGIATSNVLWNEDRAVGVWVDQLKTRSVPVTHVELPGTNGFFWDQPVKSGTWAAYPYVLAHHLSKETIQCLVNVDAQNNPNWPIDSCFAQ